MKTAAMTEKSPIINYTKNPVRCTSSADGDSITVYGLGRVGGASKGLGLLYFWIVGGGENSGFGSQFALLESTTSDYSSPEPNTVAVILNTKPKFPCVGIITGTQEGYIIAPTVQLRVPRGRDIVLMSLYPDTIPRGVSVDKTTLAIPGEDATATLSTHGGELRCLGTVTCHGFKTARILLNRNPGLPIYREGFNQTLCELKEPGTISVVWKPVTRRFEQCLLVLHPPNLSAFSMSSFLPSLTGLAEHLGAPEDDYAGTTPDYVVGDGVGVVYTIRLVLDRGFGRHPADEARLKIT